MYGRGSIASVALQIIDDYARPTDHYKYGKQRFHPKRDTRYTLDQILEKVCYRRESVLSCSDFAPSYVWWELTMDGGEVEAKIDFGKLPKNDWSNIWPRIIAENDGNWPVVLGTSLSYSSLFYPCPLYMMMTLGLSFNQRVLTRCLGSSSVDYWGEYDEHWETEIIYMDESKGIDVPLVFEVPRDGEFRGWRVE